MCPQQRETFAQCPGFFGFFFFFFEFSCHVWTGQCLIATRRVWSEWSVLPTQSWETSSIARLLVYRCCRTDPPPGLTHPDKCGGCARPGPLFGPPQVEFSPNGAGWSFYTVLTSEANAERTYLPQLPGGMPRLLSSRGFLQFWSKMSRVSWEELVCWT